MSEKNDLKQSCPASCLLAPSYSTTVWDVNMNEMMRNSYVISLFSAQVFTVGVSL